MKTRFTLLLNLLFLITPALTVLANPTLLPPPTVPTSVAATAVSTTQINLTWAAPTSADQTYLLEEARNVLPGLELREDQVRYAYAGLRPLRHVSGGQVAAHHAR